MECEKDRVPSIPSIASSRPSPIKPTMSFQYPETASTVSQCFNLRSPVKVNRNPFSSTSGPPKTTRDGIESKSHQQATQELESRKDSTHFQGSKSHQQATQELESTEEFTVHDPNTGYGGQVHVGQNQKREYNQAVNGGNSDVAVGLDDLTYDRIRNHSHFPSSHASWTSLKDYVCLRDLVRNQEYAIRASICDDIELLIFTSKHLPVDTESLTAGLKNDLFLWGLFRHAKHGPAPRNIPEEISLSGLSHGNSNSGLVSRSDDNEPGDPDDDRPNSCRESDGKSTIGVHSTVQWSPPCAGWVKLNTSAVWKEDTGTTGVGGLVHGSVSMTRLPN
ncbi:hypothetical protein CDL15_Pgr011539 [Punica granatum]|uniref:AIPP2-like SPOC-like domain-containing protein n=1 Tax=Punica granatum TaxID=22663 RepID=A0A218VU43_PUNGR|nr:hypothetical protein CDL15_Pgr011539 [Punica granatum]